MSAAQTVLYGLDGSSKSPWTCLLFLLLVLQWFAHPTSSSSFTRDKFPQHWVIAIEICLDAAVQSLRLFVRLASCSSRSNYFFTFKFGRSFGKILRLNKLFLLNWPIADLVLLKCPICWFDLLLNSVVLKCPSWIVLCRNCLCWFVLEPCKMCQTNAC